MVGGFLAVGLWALFGVEGFVAQLGLAFVGFAVGAGFVALVRLARG